MNASNILSYFAILRKLYTASPDKFATNTCMRIAFLPRKHLGSRMHRHYKLVVGPHEFFLGSSSFRRLILHFIKSPSGRHCSSQPDMSSIEGSAERKNSLQMYGRGKFGALVGLCIHILMACRPCLIPRKQISRGSDRRHTSRHCRLYTIGEMLYPARIRSRHASLVKGMLSSTGKA